MDKADTRMLAAAINAEVPLPPQVEFVFYLLRQIAQRIGEQGT